MTKPKLPFTIHVLASAWTFAGLVYERGDELQVDDRLYALSIDREGASIFDSPSSAFGIGPCPDDLKAERAAAERAEKARTLNWMKQNNPSIARRIGAEGRIRRLEAELSEGAA